MDKCQHLHVTIYSHPYACETRWEPAEYKHKAQCEDCGEWMEVEDVPEEAEQKESRS